MPSFLANTLPQISTSLLCLDISANFLSALPPALSACDNLEELNIASNPLRVLPTFLATLVNLRVLIVDSTGLSTLPANLASLEKLHTLSIRRNKMHSLPSWLCVLPALETLLVDGNPFQGPWKALMEPLLSRGPMSPNYQPSTPMFPLPSAGMRSMMTSATSETTDSEDSVPLATLASRQSREDEDVTVTSPRAPNLSRSITAPVPHTTPQLPSPGGLSRTRTTPNRAYFDKNRGNNAGPQSMFGEPGPSNASPRSPDADREIRRMKSAGELHRNYGNSLRAPSASASSSPQRHALTEYVTSASSSNPNLLNMGGAGAQDSQSVPRRFASLGVASGAMSPTSFKSRRTVDSSIWDSPMEEEGSPQPVPPLPANRVAFPQEGAYPMEHALPPRPRSKHEADKSSRWGFLKKMSMGKIRPDQPSPPVTRTSLHGSQVRGQQPFPTRPGSSRQVPSVPALDVRISTTGALLHPPEQGEPSVPPSLSRKASSDLLKISPLDQLKKATNEAAKQAPAATANNLLAPAAPATSRANKRRSFLPIDMTPIPIPNASQFVPDVTATNSVEDAEEASSSATAAAPPVPSPLATDFDELRRQEEERAREARIRALRSVMSYLRDMHDLSQTQAQTMSVYGGLPPAETPPTRSRRPTMVDNGRLPSEASVASLGSGGSSASRPESMTLRSTEGRVGMTTQTNSVATTGSDGSGSGEERKYKDDKAKRARVIREIVECVGFLCCALARDSLLTLLHVIGRSGRMSRACKSSWTSTSGPRPPPSPCSAALARSRTRWCRRRSARSSSAGLRRCSTSTGRASSRRSNGPPLRCWYRHPAGPRTTARCRSTWRGMWQTLSVHTPRS